MAKIQPEQIKYYGAIYKGSPNFTEATDRIQEKEKLSEQERTVLKNVMKKTPAYRDSPLGRMKRR